MTSEDDFSVSVRVPDRETVILRLISVTIETRSRDRGIK